MSENHVNLAKVARALSKKFKLPYDEVYTVVQHQAREPGEVVNTDILEQIAEEFADHLEDIQNGPWAGAIRRRAGIE